MLAAGEEFDLIRRLVGPADVQRADVRVGIGDDAAVVAGDGIVISTDLAIENVHFRRAWLTPSEIGYRSAMAALSDLAAMGARPIGVLTSLALRPGDAESFGPALMEGVREAVRALGGVLLGGDVTASPGDAVIDVVAVGEASPPVLRSRARPGDELWVTGVLGGAAHAVAQWLGDGEPGEAEARAYRRPWARTREARWLVRNRVPRAMIDLSDGLAGDAAHIARASNVRLVLESSTLPLHPALSGLDREAAIDLGLSGGEDYELLVVCAADSAARYREDFEMDLGCALTRVGHVEEGEGVYVIGSDGQELRYERGGYQHFRSSP